MITVDLHTHTKYSHGANSPAEMYASALDKGLTLLGFSEHSPRPLGFDYLHEYREQLTRHLPDYAREVLALKAVPREGGHGPCRVLFGMEMDWLDGQEDYTRAACTAYDFDYLLGSVHFLGRWGFDDGAEPWKNASQEECESRYTAYFTAWEAMIRSGLFNIAAHPDLIKIFSVEQFHIWLAKAESAAQIRRCLTALRDAGMAMEISSAGLRKLCKEIYPCPAIMEMARELELPITFGSDAHCTSTVAWGFDQLEEYARRFGYTHSVWFRKGVMHQRPF